jgi:lycopene beta-cyclase
MTYDYIISGGGMAGLSLAYYLDQSHILRHKKILIIDRQRKAQNDRTWCFWEIGSNTFEKVVHRSWNTIWFKSQAFSQHLLLGNYRYKMIRGIDFYTFIHNQLAKNPNIEWLEAEVTNIHSHTVITSKGSFTASYIFDSTYQIPLDTPQRHHLLQHFKGWVVQTPTPQFDPTQATMMDFTIPQEGDCRFMYVLPSSNTEALIEYTLFSEKLLSPASYDQAIHSYITDILKINTFEIKEEEFGVIPMSDSPIVPNPMSGVVRIGTAGGATKASTGYTFLRTQHRLQAFIKCLEQGKPPVFRQPFLKKRYDWLDSIFLNVFVQKRYPASVIFSHLFQHNAIRNVFMFLDEESSVVQDIKMMATLPILPFTRAAFQVIFRRLFG